MKFNELNPRWHTLETSVQSRIKIEARIVKRVIEAVLATGNWELEGIDLDEGIEKTPTVDEALKLAFDLDDARLYFKHKHNPKRSFAWVYFVFGNDGWDVVSDYTCSPDGFEQAVERNSGDDTDLGDEEV